MGPKPLLYYYVEHYHTPRTSQNKSTDQQPQICQIRLFLLPLDTHSLDPIILSCHSFPLTVWNWPSLPRSEFRVGVLSNRNTVRLPTHFQGLSLGCYLLDQQHVCYAQKEREYAG